MQPLPTISSGAMDVINSMEPLIEFVMEGRHVKVYASGAVIGAGKTTFLVNRAHATLAELCRWLRHLVKNRSTTRGESSRSGQEPLLNDTRAVPLSRRLCLSPPRSEAGSGGGV